MEREANYADFEKSMDKFIESDIHFETKNYLMATKANYFFMVNKDEALKLFEETVKPTYKPYILYYELIEVAYYINKEDYLKASELIQIFERKYPKNKGCKVFKEIVRLQDINEINEIIENIISIHTSYKFINVINATTLVVYYKARQNDEKAKYYANFILEQKTDLEECNKKARALLN